MTFSGYLTEHWGMLVMLVGLSIVLYGDKHLERRMIRRMAVTIVMIFVYSISCYTETYLGNLSTYTVLRPILSAFNYSLVTFLLVNIIMIVYPNEKKILYIPAFLNAALCFISVFSGIVFYISEDNHFKRGPLGYLTYFVDAVYLLYLLFNLFRSKNIQKEDYPIMVYLAVTSAMCLAMPLFMDEMALHWLNVTIAIVVMLYYIYLLQQNTKRDSLTNLLNRQSYYRDIEKYKEEITAFISMDMDGLKEINDKQGHMAGDVALKTLADCFWNAAHKNQRVYRIGGDEYVILCLDSTEENVKDLIDCIKKEVAQTEYSCSIGYAMKTEDSTIEMIYKLADSRMYEEKQKFYEKTGKHKRIY